MTLIAFLLSLSSHVTMTLLASLASFLAALLALIAFAVDIALYAYVKHQVGKLDGVASNTDTAPGERLSIVPVHSNSPFPAGCPPACIYAVSAYRDSSRVIDCGYMRAKSPNPSAWLLVRACVPTVP